ncbi:MAG: endonuclease/exonuclease/phosphatase family protein [Deltaproteobacteria bacterium]|nr:endonuclease/exonuclease/phosphatase family protein [Deltaproteobacteria bacterium]
MDRLRVATLNLWNKSGPWQKRMPIVAAEVDRLAPDLLGLQEVLCLETPKGAQNQATEVAGGRHWVYGEGHDLTRDWVPSGHRMTFGNALVSPHPIREHRTHPLPGADISDQQRSVLHAVVEAPLGPVDVFVTHLNWKLDEGHVRVQQVKALASLIAAEAPADGRYPPILMGDLNAEPESDEIRYLLGYTTLGEPESVRFADVWQYAEPQPSVTFDGQTNPFASEHHEPPRRIDYILVRGPSFDGHGRPVAVQRVFDQAVDGIHPSDHYGVMADLTP